MSVVGGWVFAPLVLGLLAAGHGLLLERLSGVRLTGALMLPVGLAALIALTGVLTILDSTAEFAAPVAALMAVGGFALGRARRDLRLDRNTLAPLAVAFGAFVIFAAPSILSGQASIAGYVKLDDSPTWLAMTAYVIEHGLEVDGLAASSYSRTVESWLGGTYPVGAFLPLGVASWLTATDPAAAYQGVISVYAAILALGLYAAARGLAGTPWRAAAAAVVGVQASVFLGYTQWGGIKEAATAALLPPLILAAVLVREQLRALVVLGVVAGGLLGVLGPNGAAWVLPAAAVAFAAMAWCHRPIRRAAGAVGASVLVVVVASAPALVGVDFVKHTTGGAISSQAEVGNLVKPLPLLQGAGLWPVGDFRFEPSPYWFAVTLAVTCAVAALVAAVVALRIRRFEVAALLGVAVAGTVPALVIGAPWIDAKALAIVSPFILLPAAAIVLRPLENGPGPLIAVGSALAIALPAATAWSTLKVIGDVQIAPRERLAEAHGLGKELAGEGPTVVLEPELYTSRYFMRDAEGEGASDLRFRPVATRDGGQFPHLSTAEIDQMAIADLWVYRAIVRRTSPTTSRPPAGFRTTHDGPLWEAWQRPGEAPPPLARLPLGEGHDPTGVPGCGDTRSLASTDGATQLAAAQRRPPVIVPLEPESVPPAWRAPDGVRPGGDGRVSVRAQLPVDGRWRVWVSGGVLGELEVLVDGRSAGARAHEFGHGAHWLRYDALPLEAGAHEVELRYSLGLRAGRSGPPWSIGPVALSIEESPRLLTIPVSRWRELCDGRRFDWIEALA